MRFVERRTQDTIGVAVMTFCGLTPGLVPQNEWNINNGTLTWQEFVPDGEGGFKYDGYAFARVTKNKKLTYDELSDILDHVLEGL